MKRLALATIVLGLGLAYGATDFSSMTTEELLNLRGTVAVEDRDAFRAELQSRLNSLTPEEKAALGISPKGYGDMTGTKPQDGTGLGKKAALGLEVKNQNQIHSKNMNVHQQTNAEFFDSVGLGNGHTGAGKGAGNGGGHGGGNGAGNGGGHGGGNGAGNGGGHGGGNGGGNGGGGGHH